MTPRIPKGWAKRKVGTSPRKGDKWWVGLFHQWLRWPHNSEWKVTPHDTFIYKQVEKP